MNNEFEKTWATYTKAWKVASSKEKQALFEQCMETGCEYTDPLVNTKDWRELTNYMLDFHQQVPGGHFVTHYFLAHNNQSIAKWEMKNAEKEVIGEGISYGKYSANGKLISMTGFFETP